MDGTLLCETAPFYMNWLVMLHRLLDDTSYTPTEELRRFGEAAKAGMYNTQLIDREMDDRAQYVQAEIFKGLTMKEMDAWPTKIIVCSSGPNFATLPVKMLSSLLMTMAYADQTQSSGML
jgi:hypothetical protein